MAKRVPPPSAKRPRGTAPEHMARDAIAQAEPARRMELCGAGSPGSKVSESLPERFQSLRAKSQVVDLKGIRFFG